MNSFAGEVVEGMGLVKEIEGHGTPDGKTKKKITIVRSGTV